MAKVVVSLDIWFDGSDGEPTEAEVAEFTQAMIEAGAECCGSCDVKVHSIKQAQE